MKKINTVNNENDSISFFKTNSNYDAIGVLQIIDDKFTTFIISHKEYEEHLKNTSGIDLIYCISADPDYFYSSISCNIHNNNVVLNINSCGSIRQEYFDQPSFKVEFAVFLHLMQDYLKIELNKHLLAIESINRQEVNFSNKLINRISPYSFQSLVSNKIYTFELDQKHSDEYVHNWIVNNNGPEIWIAPIKTYICINNLNNDNSVSEILELYLLKQFATLLSIENAPEHWIKEGYINLLTKYLDPIVIIK